MKNPNNVAGGLKAREKNLAKDPDFYRLIGAKGGKKSRGGGFSSMTPERIKEVSSKGGKMSHRKTIDSKNKQ